MGLELEPLPRTTKPACGEALKCGAETKPAFSRKLRCQVSAGIVGVLVPRQ